MSPARTQRSTSRSSPPAASPSGRRPGALDSAAESRDGAEEMARYLDGVDSEETEVLAELARRDRELGPPSGALEAPDPDEP